MSEEHFESSGNPALDAFIARLNHFYRVECNAPKLRGVADASHRLRKEYRSRDLQTLSPTGISEVLNNRRKKFPSTEWLTSMILSCQRRASELGVISSDPGFDSLPEWHRLLREARQRAETGREPPSAAGPPGDTHTDATPDPPQPPPASRPTYAEPPEPPESPESPESSGDTGSPDDDAASCSAMRPGEWVLSPSERRCLAGLGPYAAELSPAAESGLADAAFEVAVLIGTHRDRESEAMVWLQRAAAVGHAPAIAQLAAEPTYFDRFDAAACALDLAGRSADRAPAIAELYNQRAAACGLPGPAVTLAEGYMADGRAADARHWLEVAARHGDLAAELRLLEIRLCELRDSEIAPPSRTPKPSPASPVDALPHLLRRRPTLTTLLGRQRAHALQLLAQRTGVPAGLRYGSILSGSVSSGMS
jgi:hypothetical protein